MYTPKGELNDALVAAIKDTDFLEKLSQAKSPEECYEIAKEKGIDISQEEFTKSMEIAKAYVEESQDGILSDEDLDQVAGGKASSDKVLDTVNTALELVTSAASAAAI